MLSYQRWGEFSARHLTAKAPCVGRPRARKSAGCPGHKRGEKVLGCRKRQPCILNKGVRMPAPTNLSEVSVAKTASCL